MAYPLPHGQAPRSCESIPMLSALLCRPFGFGVSRALQIAVGSLSARREVAPGRRDRVGLGWTPPGGLGQAGVGLLINRRVENISEKETPG